MIQDLFRSDLNDFKAYEPGKTNYKVRLDANENFSNFSPDIRAKIGGAIEESIFNRYPDPAALEVCDHYAQYANVNGINVMAGNGSDECIQIITNTFLNTGDKVAMPSPDFSMYALYTKVAGGIPIEFPLDDELKLDVEGFISMANEEKVKILFLSNPNNPTGGVISRENIIKIIEECKCIVVIDEAYYEFYGKSVTDLTSEYENLIVLRTCSKFGLAAVRIGFLITGRVLMEEVKKVKPPYNVNAISQSITSVILKDSDIIYKNIERILIEKKYLLQGLNNILGIKIYKSEANFILIQVEDAQKIKEKLLDLSINVRSYGSGRLENCLRITVGSREENRKLLDNISQEK
ncbi:histidinol-phosphate transaminase [Clostridium sp.]|uniref:histidinol-phosphate transaminase n=1 Tax=Clostridium sp. TaxID=1506 RepID=UPI001A3DD742|nr:histidinol-phosphate transaminase [Clostridium sp.]MBK5241191.1 histidinol-phosphate transaminase [Clostridium sp.]